MKRQEDTIYRSKLIDLPTTSSSEKDAPDGNCRDKMLTWFFEIVDYFKYDKETVEIAVNYVDRYDCQDRLDYQLTCMTALYTAVKIHERTALHPKLVASLSQGQFTEQDLIQQERKLLHQLQWRLHPPTTLAFVREFLGWVPADQRQVVYELAQVQLQHAWRLPRVVPAYTWAYAAVLNALESLHLSCCRIPMEFDQVVQTQAILYKAISGVSLKNALSKKRSIQKGMRVSQLATEGGSPRTVVVNH
ncbi:hypothetical protein FisN_13Lh346 [Fistulifera solaris]|uniref:Cyclin-like domain-containing protein n=1 Tax=Fistulifera solaris TaxID=1519565 RepID=A0A1Z5KLB3_FISSO|nr:hypothetical protein FisN_13Lh346 [Fistulifera solaris]|eukprot:GAX27110.1 hypothetical protein FisN_13Lh346 [Fistulifera solaris]